MVPFVSPEITQVVAGATTVQVLLGLKTETSLWVVYAVIVTEVVAPTVADAATGLGVSVTSPFPAVAARVPTDGAKSVHCG